MTHLRKKDNELRKKLILCASRIECTEGVDAINIRRLAAETNIAVGTVYNYFDSKQEVLLALTEDFWVTALDQMHNSITQARFSEQVGQIIEFLRGKMNDCAEILMKSLREDAATGRIRMAATQRVLHQTLVERLTQDPTIRADAWDATLTRESFAEFVLTHIVFLMQRKDLDAGTFKKIIERVLY